MAAILKSRAIESSFYRGLEAALLFFMNVVLSRYLGPNGYGIISYTLIFLSVLSLITPLGFTTSALRFVAEYVEKNDPARLKGFVLRSFQLTLVVSLIVALTVFIASRVIGPNEYFSYSLYWVAILLPVISLCQVRRKISEGAGHIKLSVLPDLVMPSLTILLIAAASVSYAGQAFYILLFSSVTGLVCGVLVAWRNFNFSSLRVRPYYDVKLWIKVSIPMMAAGLGNLLMNRSDVLVLGVYAGMESVGQYTAAIRVVMLTVFILNAVYVVVAPQLSRAYLNGDIDGYVGTLRKATLISMAGGLAFLIPIFIWSQHILQVFGGGYEEARGVLILLALTQGVHATLGLASISLALIGYQKVFAYTVIAGACVNILFDILVAPVWGALGVAYVTLGVTLLLKTVQVYVLYRAIESKRKLQFS